MKKILAMLLALMMLFSFMTVTSFAEDAKIQATIIKVGENEQYKTVASAVEAARAIDGTVVVELAGGHYDIPETIALTSADNNLVIRAKDGEKVVLGGGHEIAYSDFKKVTDDAVLDRLAETSAQSKLMSVDLKAIGITDFGQIRECGFGITSNYAPTLTYNDRYLTIAQYPNGKDYLYTGEIINAGKDDVKDSEGAKTIEFKVRDSARWKKWTNAKDIWALGFYVHDWAESITPATISEDGAITAGTGYSSIVADRRVKFFNLLEEIDQPGEYYIDREAGVLYMILPEGFKSGESLVFSAHAKDLFTLEGCENVTFQGLRIEGTTERAIYGNNCTSCTVDACEFTAIGKDAAKFENSMKCSIVNSYAHDLGSNGFTVNGGDKPTLTKGENKIENCHIERFMQYKKTYAPAVAMYGVGNTIRHCEINDGPHEGAAYSGVYNVFEYNNVYRVCTDTSDCGAIYTGRNWADRNNEIRYNYFHDLSMINATTSYEMQAVYLDDMHSCTFVYGNVFYKVDSIALYGGGRDNTFENNVMLDSKKPFVFDARGTTWMDTGSGSQIYNNLMNSPWQTDVWKEAFPTMATILTDRTKEPVGNVIKNNIIYNTPSMDINKLVKENGTVEDAVDVKTSDFVDYGKDFTLKEDSEVFTKLPDFKNIPFKEIGRYDYEVVNKWTDNGADVPAPAPSDDTIKVIVNDKPVAFDVAPTIINDRTMVPLRAIFEALGADVDWDDATKTITAVKDDTTIKMQIGNDKMTKNGAESALDSAPVIIDSRTLVPVRAIAESFGSDVSWEAETKTVIVKDLPKEEVKDEDKKDENVEDADKADDKKAEDKAEEKSDDKTEEKKDEKTADEKTDETTTDETETKPEK